MKKLMTSVCALFVLICASTAFAGQDIPSLTGTWTVQSEGGIIVRGDQPGKVTHWEEKQTSLIGELTILTQNGRTLSGVFKSPKAEERFIGVIGHDNVSLHFADEDGMFDGKLIDQNTIESVYRHVKATDTVVAVGIWKRKQ
ncbi:hypothetical protein [uncultured Thiodictyon sp.]|uniref:hypothetical protein n=1 Tax=uncultured Thiodictyon sp. TaxID=1846217 RepID=UPI0025CD7874|nr:hypothetical protein [uncultured Thiodictyon sp.]